MAEGKKGEKIFTLGGRVKYPITITKLYKKPGDKLEKERPVLQYATTEVNDDFYNYKTGETERVEKTILTDWSAPEDAKLIKWHVKVHDVINFDMPYMTVEEACTHEIQFQGLCALCGKDMNEVSWANEHRDTERTPINMIHDQTNLKVSRMAAVRAEQELQRRLLKQRKLSLVVDLDQTIIHACIEPTIGEWQQDTSNPNHEAVKDVKSFQLNDDGPRGLASGCWYYIKMRPGLIDFLGRIAELYELHVYTMGTRAYAMNIAKIVDPEQKLFANRVISRDENGSLVAKSLERLFPVSTNMVIIIDDRADVWPRNRPNLIKVTPYDFFKGIGDINSSFLPKREDQILVNSRPVETNGVQKPLAPGPPPDNTKVSALQEIANMGGGENMVLLKKQTEEQEKSLEKQIKDRPLLHMQEQLDKQEESTQEPEEPGHDTTEPLMHSRHHLLLDDDNELTFVEQHLTRLHKAFFDEYDAKRNGSFQNRKGNWDEEADISTVPDVGGVMDRLKANVLGGTTIVLSGLVPLGVDAKLSEIGLQALSFGARLESRISRSVTHLVISSDRPRTQKVRQAARIPSIKIVNQNWLADCLSQWTLLDETPYMIEIHPADRMKLSAAATPTETTDAETISDIEGDENMVRPNGTRLKIIVSGPSDADGEGEDLGEAEDGRTVRTGRGMSDPNDMSPIDDLKTFDWGSADDELAAFLAEEEDDDGDGDGDGDEDADIDDDVEVDMTDAGESEAELPANGKRKHEGDTEADVTLAKKLRVGRGRPPSSLRATHTPEDEGSLPTPQITGDEEDTVAAKLDGVPMDDVDEDDELEEELMAELEAEEALAENG